MERRAFLKTLGLAAAAPLIGGRLGLADETVPHAATIPLIPFDAPPGSWTLAVLPDTQNMSQSWPAEFDRQTAWIVAHQKTHHILFVAHEGDLVEINDDLPQWKNAQKSMRILTAAGVPYSLLPGNHDLGRGDGKATDRSTNLNAFFSADDYRHSEAFALFQPGRMENSWHHLTTPTGKYLILALEFGPRDETLAWANEVLAQNVDRKVILVTHAHTCFDNTIFDWQKFGAKQGGNPKCYALAAKSSANDARDVWNKLIAKHDSIFLVLSGHVLATGTGYNIGTRANGSKVHQVLANYQALVEPHRPYGGGGFLRLMRFYPDGNTIDVKSYSPWLDQWLTTPTQQFTIQVT